MLKRCSKSTLHELNLKRLYQTNNGLDHIFLALGNTIDVNAAIDSSSLKEESRYLNSVTFDDLEFSNVPLITHLATHPRINRPTSSNRVIETHRPVLHRRRRIRRKAHPFSKSHPRGPSVRRSSADHSRLSRSLIGCRAPRDREEGLAGHWPRREPIKSLSVLGKRHSPALSAFAYPLLCTSRLPYSTLRGKPSRRHR